MPTVCLMEFNRTKKNFQVLRDAEFASVPTSGDKVVIDIDGIGYVFEVYDVHYTDNNGVDVNLIRKSTLTDYQDYKNIE